MSRRLGAAILGTGDVSGEHIKAFAANPHTRVAAILSRDASRAQAKAAAYNLEDCRACSRLEDVLGDPEVDIVSVCTPHHLHVEQGVAAAEAGKHVVVEKPIALELAGLRKLDEAVRRARVKSVVSFVLRWNPLFENIRAVLAQGLIGEVFYAEVDYLHGIGQGYTGWDWIHRPATGGSSFLSAGCHAVDALRWFVGQEAVEVQAVSNVSRRNPAGWRFEPNTVALIRFAGGVMGKVASSIEAVMPYAFNILLLGDEGTVRQNQLFTRRWPGQNGWAVIPAILPDSGAVSHHPFQGEIDHLVDCILEDRESHCNIADSVKTHEICLAADLAAREARPVRLPLG